jgi:hypothetical protein
MKLAIMQPYFLPYIGYWQLIHAVDTFVILDDVNFISRKYINRNNLLLNGQAHLFSISLEKASQNRLINEININFPSKEREKFLKTIQSAYKKAPCFKDVYPLIENMVCFSEINLSKFIEHSLRKICAYLGINTVIAVSSEIEKDESLKAQARIIEICQRLKATTYINPPGGKSLYVPEDFQRQGIELRFLQPGKIEYRQFGAEFIPNLSILDVLMFNSLEQIRATVQNDYKLH